MAFSCNFIFNRYFHTGNPTVSFCSDGREAATAEELNQTLGGVHWVSGDTLTLQEDVNLSNTVRIIGAKDLKIDANKKTITYDKDVVGGPFDSDQEELDAGTYYSHMLQGNLTPMFYISKSQVTVSGEGNFRATGKAGAILYDYDKSNITIDNGLFYTGDGIPLLRGFDEKNIRSKITINGGTFDGNNTSPYTDPQTAILVGDGSLTDITVNGGVMGAIHMNSPFYYSYNERYFYSNHNLVINGGTISALQVKKELEVFQRQPMPMSR